MDMNNYYKYRQKIRDLYDHEQFSSNDLGSSIFEVRDRNRCIVSMSLDLNKYYIEAEFEEGTTFEKIDKILTTILKKIGYFLSDNIDSLDLNDEEKSEVLSMITSPCMNFCDHIIIGNIVKINL